MTDETPSGSSRPWKRWAAIAVVAVLFLALYPQLQDFGAELYKFFS